jgi:hypothetical protein
LCRPRPCPGHLCLILLPWRGSLLPALPTCFFFSFWQYVLSSSPIAFLPRTAPYSCIPGGQANGNTAFSDIFAGISPHIECLLAYPLTQRTGVWPEPTGKIRWESNKNLKGSLPCGVPSTLVRPRSPLSIKNGHGARRRAYVGAQTSNPHRTQRPPPVKPGPGMGLRQRDRQN